MAAGGPGDGAVINDTGTVSPHAHRMSDLSSQSSSPGHGAFGMRGRDRCTYDSLGCGTRNGEARDQVGIMHATQVVLGAKYELDIFSMSGSVRRRAHVLPKSRE